MVLDIYKNISSTPLETDIFDDTWRAAIDSLNDENNFENTVDWKKKELLDYTSKQQLFSNLKKYKEYDEKRRIIEKKLNN